MRLWRDKETSRAEPNSGHIHLNSEASTDPLPAPNTYLNSCELQRTLTSGDTKSSNAVGLEGKSRAKARPLGAVHPPNPHRNGMP